MIETYKRPKMPVSFKRPYITIDGDAVTLHFTIYGVTCEREFETIKAADDYAKNNSIDDLPDAIFYD